MRKKKFHLGIGAIVLLVASALAYRSSKVFSVTKLYFTSTSGMFTQCNLLCNNVPSGLFRTSGVGVAARLATCNGTGIVYLFATSTCHVRLCFIP